MISDLAQTKTRLQSLAATFEDLAKEAPSGNTASNEEQEIFERISKKLDDIRTQIATAEAASQAGDTQGANEGDVKKRKQGRLGKIKDMQSSIAGLMASLKSAR